MSAELAPQPLPAEWRHSGPYLLLAVALHALVLAYPLSGMVRQLDLPEQGPVFVRLTDQATAPIPLSPPQAPPTPTPPRQPVAARPTPAVTPRPVIAMPVESSSAAPTFSVPAPATPPAASPVATPSNPAPAIPITLSAARFDAAYLQNPRPSYPPISRRLGEEGKVLLKVRVTVEGMAASVDLEKTSGFERLDDAARQAVARWRFVPAKRGDEPIEASVIVPIVFRLDT